jgi:hypothetical protein
MKNGALGSLLLAAQTNGLRAQDAVVICSSIAVERQHCPANTSAGVALRKIFGDQDAGFGKSDEYLGNMNFYFSKSQNHDLNVQVIDVNQSPVSSSFGYYVGGQKGTTVSSALSIFC